MHLPNSALRSAPLPSKTVVNVSAVVFDGFITTCLIIILNVEEVTNVQKTTYTKRFESAHQ